ncbi:bifunctional DNA primase/polymerase [Streptomyces sp. H39-S7]|uniref:bifunctional DNA primase/polymerase n=1 Tax=Streptomyces sp. H39-S7 TaxID=3004357 RepID=UPI0022AF0B5D|nr:bifunctional DNA primase/polymerase [Streptomyces sp. H39-S7]MCZ4124966.1 bifunctional DNA primase/polymerase [Streptomyces sp. H39-S7]
MSADPASTTAAALDLTRRGLAVFALPPGGRRPDAGGWSSRCWTDPGEVQRLWCEGDNIGVGCRASHLVGLDLDVDGAGQDVLAALAACLGEPWPDTLTVATPSQGAHLYFRAPPGCSIASVSGGRTALGPGVDVRGPGLGSGGYLIGPGSVVDGIRYVIERDLPVQPLPHWITDRLGRGTGSGSGKRALNLREAH